MRRSPSFAEAQPFDEHNRALVGNVHPPEWVNPVPTGRYNLVVIGAGTAGLVTAAGAAGLGAKVALVERRLMGGDCLNVGCVPSKALLRSARAITDLRRASELGVIVPDGARIDFPAVMERVRRLRAGMSPHDSARRFRELGVDVYFGDARFTGRDTIDVGGQPLRFARACIATGARAVVPDLPGLRDAGFFTNETIFTLTELPARLVVIGGGPIGCELAQAFARLGSRVTLVTRDARLLPRDEPEASAAIEAALARDGVAVAVRANPLGVEPADGGRRLVYEQEGKERVVDGDAILVAVGRAPNVDGLGLDAAGVELDQRRGVRVNDFLQTTNPTIYAAGDVASSMRFTHAADAMARIVIQNALFFGRARFRRLVVPWCTYTDPEAGHVGLTRAECDARRIVADDVRVPLAAVDRAILDGETEGFLHILARRGGGEILGATLVARHAGDILGEITTAIRAGLTLKDFAATIHAYPTQAEVVRKAADAWNRTRLTPRVKRWMERLLRWRRGSD